MKNTYTRREFLSMAGLSAIAVALAACSGLNLSKEDEDALEESQIKDEFNNLFPTPEAYISALEHSLSNVTDFVNEFDQRFPNYEHTAIQNPQAQRNEVIVALCNPAKMDLLVLRNIVNELKGIDITSLTAYDLNKVAIVASQNALAHDVLKYLSPLYSPVFAIYRWQELEPLEVVEDQTNIQGSELKAAFEELQKYFAVPFAFEEDANPIEAFFTPLDGKIVIGSDPSVHFLDVMDLSNMSEEHKTQIKNDLIRFTVFHEFAHALDVIANPNILRFLDREARFNAIALKTQCLSPLELAKLIPSLYSEIYSNNLRNRIRIDLLTSDSDDIDITKASTYAATNLAHMAGKSVIVDTLDPIDSAKLQTQMRISAIYFTQSLFEPGSTFSINDLDNSTWKRFVKSDQIDTPTYKILERILANEELKNQIKAEILKTNQERLDYLTSGRDTQPLPYHITKLSTPAEKMIDEDEITISELNWLLSTAYISEVLGPEFDIEIYEEFLTTIYAFCNESLKEHFAEVASAYMFLVQESTSVAEKRESVETLLVRLEEKFQNELEYVRLMFRSMEETDPQAFTTILDRLYDRHVEQVRRV